MAGSTTSDYTFLAFAIALSAARCFAQPQPQFLSAPCFAQPHPHFSTPFYGNAHGG
jgi:hypothetical protein